MGRRVLDWVLHSEVGLGAVWMAFIAAALWTSDLAGAALTAGAFVGGLVLGALVVADRFAERGGDR